MTVFSDKPALRFAQSVALAALVAGLCLVGLLITLNVRLEFAFWTGWLTGAVLVAPVVFLTFFRQTAPSRTGAVLTSVAVVLAARCFVAFWVSLSVNMPGNTLVLFVSSFFLRETGSVLPELIAAALTYRIHRHVFGPRRDGAAQP